jgi:hypothetical protein
MVMVEPVTCAPVPVMVMGLPSVMLAWFEAELSVLDAEGVLVGEAVFVDAAVDCAAGTTVFLTATWVATAVVFTLAAGWVVVAVAVGKTLQAVSMTIIMIITISFFINISCWQ